MSNCKIKFILNSTDGASKEIELEVPEGLSNESNIDDIVKYLPSPENKQIAGFNMKTNEVFEANYDFSKAKSAYVFKTIADVFIGKYSLIKVCSGVFKSDDVIYNKDDAFEYVKGDHIFAVIPKGVLTRYVSNPEIAEEVKQLIKAGKYENPIYYPADKGFKRRIIMRLRDINYFRKYKNNPLHEKL